MFSKYKGTLDVQVFRAWRGQGLVARIENSSVIQSDGITRQGYKMIESGFGQVER